MQGEGIVETSHEKILVLKAQDTWNGLVSREKYSQWLLSGIEELESLAGKYDGQAIRCKMKGLVPEYRLQDGECTL